ncbi:MAG: hypothetical protein ABFS39_11420 [Pseudomonadota bacterium]
MGDYDLYKSDLQQLARNQFLAKLWLITLHPFDEGNGRVARAVTDRALAQAKQSTICFYSLSAVIMVRRKEYFAQLEAAQKDSADITQWLAWFLSVFEDVLNQGLKRFERVNENHRFWQSHSQTVLTERQIKVFNHLLDGQGEEFEQGNKGSYAIVCQPKPTSARIRCSVLGAGFVMLDR